MALELRLWQRLAEQPIVAPMERHRGDPCAGGDIDHLMQMPVALVLIEFESESLPHAVYCKVFIRTLKHRTGKIWEKLTDESPHLRPRLNTILQNKNTASRPMHPTPVGGLSRSFL